MLPSATPHHDISIPPWIRWKTHGQGLGQSKGGSPAAGAAGVPWSGAAGGCRGVSPLQIPFCWNAAGTGCVALACLSPSGKVNNAELSFRIWGAGWGGTGGGRAGKAAAVAEHLLAAPRSGRKMGLHPWLHPPPPQNGGAAVQPGVPAPSKAGQGHWGELGGMETLLALNPGES